MEKIQEGKGRKTFKERDTERERETQTDREKERQTDRQRERQRERERWEKRCLWTIDQSISMGFLNIPLASLLFCPC